MIIGRRRSIGKLVVTPFLIALLLISVFALVFVRSQIVKLEYRLGELEKKKTLCLRERKVLFAEKTSQLSFARLEASSQSQDGFVLPDRLKVVQIGKHTRSMPSHASFKEKQLAEP